VIRPRPDAGQASARAFNLPRPAGPPPEPPGGPGGRLAADGAECGG